MLSALLIGPVFFIGLIILIVYLVVKGVSKKTFKSMLVIFCVWAALLGILVFNLNSFTKKFAWQKDTYDRNDLAVKRSLDESTAELIETYYVYPHGWSSTDGKDFWYQTAWYESAEDLAEKMAFDDVQTETFLSCYDSSNITTEFLKYDLNSVPVNEDIDVTYYSVDHEVLGLKTPDNDPVGYFLVVNNDTEDIALVVFYAYCYRG